MPARPFYSIITVTWQDLPGLRVTGASVAEQSEGDWEWLVIDGGSKDGSVEWLSGLSDPRLRWTSERDNGTYDAMNQGLDRSTGRYVLFLNGGDSLAASDTLAAVRRCIDSADAEPDLVYGDSIDVQSDGTEFFRASRGHGWLRYGMFTSHQAMFFRKDHMPSLRYDLRYPTSADYAFIAAFLHPPAGARCAYLARALCRFSLGGTHFVRRRQGLWEDFRIRRTLLHQPLAMAFGLYALHVVHHFLKRTVPGLTRVLRYRRVAAAAAERPHR